MSNRSNLPLTLAGAWTLVGALALAGTTAPLRAAVAVLIAADSPTASAKPAIAWPETPAGEIGRAWLDAFLRGEPAMRAYYKEFATEESLAARSVESRLETYRNLRQQLGRLRLVEVSENEPLRVTVTFEDEHDLRHEFSFRVTESAPHRLESIEGRVRQRHGLFSH